MNLMILLALVILNTMLLSIQVMLELSWLDREQSLKHPFKKILGRNFTACIHRYFRNIRCIRNVLVVLSFYMCFINHIVRSDHQLNPGIRLGSTLLNVALVGVQYFYQSIGSNYTNKQPEMHITSVF